MKPLNLLEQLDKGAGAFGFIATYEFDPQFFERRILAKRTFGSADRLVVFMDQGRYQELINGGLQVSGFNRRYLVVPMELDPTGGIPPPEIGPETLRGGSSVLLEPGGGDQVRIRFERPGFVFTNIANPMASSSDPTIELTPPSIQVLNSGRVVEMTLMATGKKTGWFLSWLRPAPPVLAATIAGEISARLKPDIRPAITASEFPEPHVQSFLVSKTLDVHSDAATRQNYSDRVPAPNGYRFLKVLKVTLAGSSHATGPIDASVASEGSFVRVTYELESGPRSDPWTAWLDAFVTASLAPVSTR